MTLLVMVALLAALQVWIFRWGVITPDAVEQYGQALTGRYEDWHPPVMAWLWRMLLNVHRGSEPFLILDCALYWLGFGLIAEAFRRRGQVLAALGALAIGLLPIPFGQMGSILKDSLLSASLIAATGVIGFHHLLDRRIGWPCAAGLAVLLILAAATRFNAVFAVAPLALHALSPRIWQGRWYRIVPGLLATALMLAASSHLINNVLLRPVATRPLLSLINFDLAGISRWSGRSLYPMPAKPSLQLVGSCYSPAMYSPHDTARCNAVEDQLGVWLKATGTAPLVVWTKAVVAAPAAYLRHRALHFNANQRWFVRRVPDDAIYIMSAENDLGLSFRKRPQAVAVYRAASLMAQSPLGRPATWLAVAAAVLALGRMEGQSLARALAASALLYSSAYAVVSVAPDMRYNSWPMVAVPLALLLTMAGEWPHVRPLRLLIAAMLVSAAVAGEAAGVLFG